MPSGRWRRRRRRRRRRSVSKPYETRGRGSGERPRIHFPPLRDVTRVRRNLFGRVFSRFGAAAGRGGHRSHGRRGEAKPARDEPRTVDAWTEEAARGAAAGGRTSERVVHAQVCEGTARRRTICTAWRTNMALFLVTVNNSFVIGTYVSIADGVHIFSVCAVLYRFATTALAKLDLSS
ncbi:hypothetical protein PAHAL_3G055000 [Panicum hallii]|uniref:Uncharacterized protein n=1 Tax=Panicum hallii TaxID=206008 RepID=A0A2T8KH80_9POAL|nr:hypothetical protein PAHAL_3G055000 [Panicum hallii]